MATRYKLAVLLLGIFSLFLGPKGVSASTSPTKMFTMEAVQADDAGQIMLIVAPHGNMPAIPQHPHFTDGHRQFRVLLTHVNLGNAKLDETNQRIIARRRYTLFGSPFARSLEFIPAKHSLEMILWLKPRIRRYVSLTAGGFMLGYTFRK